MDDIRTFASANIIRVVRTYVSANVHFLFSSPLSYKDAVIFRARNTIDDFCDEYDNVCAGAVSTLILLPVVNISLKTDSTTSTPYMTWKI